MCHFVCIDVFQSTDLITVQEFCNKHGLAGACHNGCSMGGLAEVGHSTLCELSFSRSLLQESPQ